MESIVEDELTHSLFSATQAARLLDRFLRLRVLPDHLLPHAGVQVSGFDSLLRQRPARSFADIGIWVVARGCLALPPCDRLVSGCWTCSNR
jgi:hypothetical protein